MSDAIPRRDPLQNRGGTPVAGQEKRNFRSIAVQSGSFAACLSRAIDAGVPCSSRRPPMRGTDAADLTRSWLNVSLCTFVRCRRASEDDQLQLASRMSRSLKPTLPSPSRAPLEGGARLTMRPCARMPKARRVVVRTRPKASTSIAGGQVASGDATPGMAPCKHLRP